MAQQRRLATHDRFIPPAKRCQITTLLSIVPEVRAGSAPPPARARAAGVKNGSKALPSVRPEYRHSRVAVRSRCRRCGTSRTPRRGAIVERVASSLAAQTARVLVMKQSPCLNLHCAVLSITIGARVSKNSKSGEAGSAPCPADGSWSSMESRCSGDFSRRLTKRCRHAAERHMLHFFST